jgi:hypothetical protein
VATSRRSAESDRSHALLRRLAPLEFGRRERVPFLRTRDAFRILGSALCLATNRCSLRQNMP